MREDNIKKDTERKQTSHKNEEKLSQREWRELMGVYKPTYKRVRGAFRQK